MRLAQVAYDRRIVTACSVIALFLASLTQSLTTSSALLPLTPSSSAAAASASLSSAKYRSTFLITDSIPPLAWSTSLNCKQKKKKIRVSKKKSE